METNQMSRCRKYVFMPVVVSVLFLFARIPEDASAAPSLGQETGMRMSGLIMGAPLPGRLPRLPLLDRPSTVKRDISQRSLRQARTPLSSIIWAEGAGSAAATPNRKALRKEPGNGSPARKREPHFGSERQAAAHPAAPTPIGLAATPNDGGPFPVKTLRFFEAWRGNGWTPSARSEQTAYFVEYNAKCRHSRTLQFRARNTRRVVAGLLCAAETTQVVRRSHPTFQNPAPLQGSAGFLFLQPLVWVPHRLVSPYLF